MPLSINKKKLAFVFIFSVITAFIISVSLNSIPLEERFINLAVAQDLDYLQDSIKNESIETKAILLDYADRKELVFKAWIALKKYPQQAKKIFLLYGEATEFQQALLQFGEHVIPVSYYFFQNEDALWNLQISMATVLDKVNDFFTSQPNHKKVVVKLSPAQRGWYAINFINEEGHNFLGQFEFEQKYAKWIQTDRFTKALSEFFTGGIRKLETQYKTGQKITTADLVWASFDVIAVTSSLKLLKSSKALTSAKVVRPGRKFSMIQKTRVFAYKFLKTKTARKMVKYGALTTATYLAITHPGLINNLFEESTHFLGVNPQLVKLLGWTILIFLLLYPLTWLCNYLIKPSLFVLKVLLAWGIKCQAFLYKNNVKIKPLAIENN